MELKLFENFDSGAILSPGEYAMIETTVDVPYQQKGAKRVVWEPGTQLLAWVTEGQNEIWIRCVKEGGFPISDGDFRKEYKVIEKIDKGDFWNLVKTQLPSGFEDPPLASGFKFDV